MPPKSKTKVAKQPIDLDALRAKRIAAALKGAETKRRKALESTREEATEGDPSTAIVDRISRPGSELSYTIDGGKVTLGSETAWKDSVTSGRRGDYAHRINEYKRRTSEYENAVVTKHMSRREACIGDAVEAANRFAVGISPAGIGAVLSTIHTGDGAERDAACILSAPEPKRVRSFFALTRVLSAGANGSVASATLSTSNSSNDSSFIVKSPIDPASSAALDGIHEAFIGLKVINPLRARIPNFMYTFAAYRCSPPLSDKQRSDVATWCATAGSSKQVTYTLVERVPPSPIGTDVRSAIRSGRLGVRDFCAILAQVVCALAIANQEYKFTHYDLHDQNVMLREAPPSSAIEYENVAGSNYTIDAPAIGVIIDYGMSFAVVDGKRSFHLADELLRFGVMTDRDYMAFDIFKFVGFCLYSFHKAGVNIVDTRLVELLYVFMNRPKLRRGEDEGAAAVSTLRGLLDNFFFLPYSQTVAEGFDVRRFLGLVETIGGSARSVPRVYSLSDSRGMLAPERDFTDATEYMVAYEQERRKSGASLEDFRARVRLGADAEESLRARVSALIARFNAYNDDTEAAVFAPGSEPARSEPVSARPQIRYVYNYVGMLDSLRIAMVAAEDYHNATGSTPPKIAKAIRDMAATISARRAITMETLGGVEAMFRSATHDEIEEFEKIATPYQDALRPVIESLEIV